MLIAIIGVVIRIYQNGEWSDELVILTLTTPKPLYMSLIMGPIVYFKQVRFAPSHDGGFAFNRCLNRAAFPWRKNC